MRVSEGFQTSETPQKPNKPLQYHNQSKMSFTVCQEILHQVMKI